MKTFLVIVVVYLFGVSSAHGAGKSCGAKENIAVEYLQWKKEHQKFMTKYDDMDSEERFSWSTTAMKNILDKMRLLSEKTLIPMPEKTFIHATGLLKEIQEGRMSRMIAVPILKSSLSTLESSMDEMLSKAIWKNPDCNFVVSDRKNTEFSKSAAR